LKEEGIPAIEGVDTRSLTRRLRERGTMDGYLLGAAPGLPPDELEQAKAKAHAIEMKRVVADLALSRIQRFAGGDLRILVIDTGAKENIIRSLQERGATVILTPFSADWEPMLDEVDGVMLTNGPGDPEDLHELVGKVRTILARSVPTFGICLGHQLLALALGLPTYKLKFGHRGSNHPVKDLTTGVIEITTQNHGFAVRGDGTLPEGVEITHVNLNDGTVEGLRSLDLGAFSVQYHPEASPGPHDARYLFGRFRELVEAAASTGEGR
jgi:carbamoyl-phosphate synthase small subunit